MMIVLPRLSQTQILSSTLDYKAHWVASTKKILAKLGGGEERTFKGPLSQSVSRVVSFLVHPTKGDLFKIIHSQLYSIQKIQKPPRKSPLIGYHHYFSDPLLINLRNLFIQAYQYGKEHTTDTSIHSQKRKEKKQVYNFKYHVGVEIECNDPSKMSITFAPIP